MKPWPKLVGIGGPETPMAERVIRYQANIQAIRASGHSVPTAAFADTLDEGEIAAWISDKDRTMDRIKRLIRRLSELPHDMLIDWHATAKRRKVHR